MQSTFNKPRSIIRTAVIFLLVISGCDIAQEDDSRNLQGIYVLNQGNYTDGVASITVYNPNNDSVEQNAFQHRNGRPLGSVGQSMTQIGDLLYTVINNSHKVEVLLAENLQHASTINFADSLSPRYMIRARNEIGYVTNWAGSGSPGYVTVIDLANQEVLEHIQVGVGPEQLVRVGNRVYVANSGLGNGQTVSVINTGNHQVIDTIQVSDYPVNVSVDAAGRLWVLCQGALNNFDDPEDDTPGRLYVIDGNDGTKLDSLEIGLNVGSEAHPSDFALNNNDAQVYLLKGGVHRIQMSSLELEEVPFIEGNFFALEYANLGDQGRIYSTDAKGFDQAGEAFIYDLEGNAIDSFQTAVGPWDFHFDVN